MSNVSPVSTANFDAEVLKSAKPVLVDFWAEWCGPCKMIAPLLDEISAEQGDKLKIVKVNVDNEQALAQKFGIVSIPTLLLFKGGVVKEQIVGLAPKKALLEKISAHY
ncbi:MAG: thioredoxin [Verrucomicrobia bacterium Tous-C9LFEB]|nr:MAG: thioredoxin [Verrucomicrobia bacterium Tous-C9LFEB]